LRFCVYHNPKRQRGIAFLRLSQPEASVLKLRVCDYPNPTRQRGIEFLRFGSVCKNPSLTRRVMILPCVFDPLISPSFEFAQLQKASARDCAFAFRQCLQKSLTDVSGCENPANDQSVRPAQGTRVASGNHSRTKKDEHERSSFLSLASTLRFSSRTFRRAS